MAKFKPKCLKGEIQTAFTNRGHLIPCCYCDEDEDLATPQLKRLTDVSKISEVTINKCYKKLEKIKDDLLPVSILKIYSLV